MDYVLSKNLAEADDYIKLEDDRLREQSRMLHGFMRKDEFSDYSEEEFEQMKQIQLVH